VLAVCLVSAAVNPLNHLPRLDDVRRTLTGALLLGRIFSPRDILACRRGIGFSGTADRPRAGGRIVPAPEVHAAREHFPTSRNRKMLCKYLIFRVFAPANRLA
jgi:hypothetical protein